MPLKSFIFADDAALESCLLHDAAHVVPGAHGRHVGKIQKALLVVDRAKIAPQELRSTTYGHTTTAAVLEFKRKRKIINHSYQTQADNIVGKMTIARLDEEIVALEGHSTSGRSACGGVSACSPAAPVRAFETASPFAANQLAKKALTPAEALVFSPKLKQHAAVLRFVWQDTSAAVALGGGMLHAFKFMMQARAILAPHGIDFDSPIINFGPEVPDHEQVLTGSPASCFSVRAAAERVMPGNASTLRVICCPFSDANMMHNGVTDGGKLGDWDFPKFVLINVRKMADDGVTLLHEMLHAAGAPYPPHDSEPLSVFSEPKGVARTLLRPEHAEILGNPSKAFFAQPRLRPF